MGSSETKDRHFCFLNLNMKDPEYIAGKIMIEYTVTVIIRLLPKSTCKFLHPNIGKKICFFPKSQGTTSVFPKSECRNLHLDLGNTPPSTWDIVKKTCLSQGADFCTLSSAKKCTLHLKDI